MMKPIPRYHGKYLINESGIVVTQKGHVMRTAKSNAGYLRTALEQVNEDGVFERKNESIHRLVAETFLENPDNLPCVMHKDNDKLNNHVSNLKYGTNADNTREAIADGLTRERDRRHSEQLSGSKSIYEIYNEDESEVIRCIGREEVADVIQYELISLKNMVGNGRKITLGPYAGYMIRRTPEKVKLIDGVPYNVYTGKIINVNNNIEHNDDYVQRLSLDEGVKPQAYYDPYYGYIDENCNIGGRKIQLQLEENHTGSQTICLEINNKEKRCPFIFS